MDTSSEQASCGCSFLLTNRMTMLYSFKVLYLRMRVYLSYNHSILHPVALIFTKKSNKCQRLGIIISLKELP